MTAYVSPNIFTSKRALLEAAETGNLVITEPTPWADILFNARTMKVGQSIVITNHPKRNKFATLTRITDGDPTVKANFRVV